MPLRQMQPPVRIIPADAGSTSKCPRCERYVWDHPRGCGEHKERNSSRLSRMGSSPRMRGALLNMRVNSGYGGIIPADAGSTHCERPCKTRYRDHPRGCGEHLAPWPVYYESWGSSPRMRGARWCRVGHDAYERIIPADAGSTSVAGSVGDDKPDHPRGCGEHLEDQSWRLVPVGSSPRMRGAPRRRRRFRVGGRIIPADAGSTENDVMGLAFYWDHPRGCGEHQDNARQTSCK